MYRVFRWLAFAGLTVLTGSPALSAEQIAATQAVRVESAAVAPVATMPVSFGATLDGKLKVLVATAENDQQRAWLAQIKSFYVARSGKPVWVSPMGFNALAETAMKELALGGDWGLNVSAMGIPPKLVGTPAPELSADAEIELTRAVVNYAHQARGGRITPQALSLWLDRTPDPVFATAVMIDMISAKDVAEALRAMHPKSPDFEMLRQAYIAMRHGIENPRASDPSQFLSPGLKIKDGQSHPQIALIRQRLGVPASGGSQYLFDDRLGDAVAEYVASAGVEARWGVIDDKVRAVFNRPPKVAGEKDLMRILANMERWRWLPRDLGRIHIWNNLPEQMTRVFKNGQVIHEERIIVGQPETQTPVFSETMKAVVFQPEWGVPPSIKINDLLPKLQADDYGVLARRDMRILKPSGDEVDPEDLNWDKIDIRQVGIYQRASDNNPLGLVKFLFPNKHHVYMHDTNARSLFAAAERTFSHGCIRVRNPQRLAEIILDQDKGWTPKQVERELLNWDKPNNKVYLDHPIPVHNVYFTLLPGKDGKLIELDDVYGHDKRISDAFKGVPVEKIAASDPARDLARELEEAAPAAVTKPRVAQPAGHASEDEN